MNVKKIFSQFTVIAAAFLSTLSCPSFSYANTFQQEHVVVGKIEIIIVSAREPGSKITERLVREKLKTREGDFFSQTTFDQDLKMLSKDFDRLEPLIEITDGKIYLTLKVWEKPHIKAIRWEGNEQIKAGTLESELALHAGNIFDRQQFNEAFHRVKTYYVKKGFFEAELNYTSLYDELTNEIEIIIEIKEGRSGKIKDIIFEGFSRREEQEILEMMLTKKYNFFLSWLTGEGIYNEEMIQHDQFQILNYLYNHGYADAKVELKIHEAKENHRIIVEILAEKGERYFLQGVSLEGNTLFCDEEILLKLPIREGEPFSPEKIHESIQVITNLYGRIGYIEAVINYEPKLAQEGHSYDLKITIDEGKPYRVGMIKVLGNRTTQTKVILHETLLIPGELFNLEKLQLTEARLKNIGYFKNVNVYAVKTEENNILPSNYRDVHIEVEEANTGHLGASFGFSSDESLFGGINLTERNFNAAGLKHLFSEGFKALRGGGEYLHINFTFGSRADSYGLSWTKPYFMDTPWSVGFDIERGVNGYMTNDYEIYTWGLTLHATYAYNAFVRFGTHYRLKYANLHVEEEECEGKKEDEKRKCIECKQLKKQSRNNGVISALGASWTYDSTDSPLRPTHGIKSNIEGEIAGLGGKWTFFSFDYINSYYYDLFGLGTLKFRGDIHFIQPLGKTHKNNIPLDERFFLGGDSDVRGYRPYRLGPKFCGDKDDPKGGISMQLLSVEFCRPLFSRAEGFVFFDAGSVTMKPWHFGELFQSYGFGTRLKIFEGTPPLTVGFGFPINPQDRSDVKRFFISVGGKF